MEQLIIHNLKQNKTLGEVLKENGVSFNEFENYWMISNSEMIGSGSFGKIFDIGNNKVLKITKDKSEYKAFKECFEALKNQNNDWFKHFVLLPEVICPINEAYYNNYDSLVKDKKHIRYYFIFKKLYELSNDDGYVFRLILNYLDKDGFDEIEEFDDLTIDEIENYFQINWKITYRKYGRENIIKILCFVRNIVEFSQEFNFHDLHIGNIMKNNNGDFILIDYRSGTY